MYTLAAKMCAAVFNSVAVRVAAPQMDRYRYVQMRGWCVAGACQWRAADCECTCSTSVQHKYADARTVNKQNHDVRLRGYRCCRDHIPHARQATEPHDDAQSHDLRVRMTIKPRRKFLSLDTGGHKRGA